MIPLFKCYIHEEAIERAANVLRSGWTGLGPVTEKFEKEVADFLDTPYAVAFNSGTAALQAAISLADLEMDSFVITTPITFVSTNHVILQEGLNPLFADIDYNTGSISTKSVQRLLESKYGDEISAIMVVHYGGSPVDLDGIYDLAEEYRIPVIEDCAHAFGAYYDRKRIGCKWTRFACFSFHAVKPLPIGEGGMLTTNDPKIAENAKRIRWLGINKSTADRTEGGIYSWKYDCNEVGFKSHMSDYQAAIGIGQLHHYEEFRIKRSEIVELYWDLLRQLTMKLGIDFAVPVLTLNNTMSANHLMAILCLNSQVRDRIMTNLKAKDIQTGVHYAPNYNYPMYWEAYKEGGCKNAEMFSNRELSLPLHLSLTEGDISLVCSTIADTAKEMGYGD